MAASQFLAYFTDSYGYGWTERYWIDWGGLPSQFALNLNGFVFARNNVLSNDCALNHIRVSSGAYRNPSIYDVNPNPGSPTGKFAGPACADFARLMLRWTGTGGYGRTFLGGVPQSKVIGDNFNPGADYIGPLNAFTQFFVNTVWFIMSTISGGKPQQKQATVLTPQMPRGYSFNCENGFLAQNDTIRMHGSTVPGFNGVKVVTKVVDALPLSTIYVGGGSPSNPGPIADQTFVTKENPTQVQITGGTFEGITRRSAGRPFGQRRGRARSVLPLRR